MIDLNKEAEDYIQKVDNQTGTMWSESTQEIVKVFVDFIENSKYVQSKIIQAQIDILLKYQQKLGAYEPITGVSKQQIQIGIYELKNQLKQLEDENK
jgi:ribosomal protein S8